MIIEVVEAATTAICQAEDAAALREAIRASMAMLGLQSFNLSVDKRHAQDFMADPTLTSFASEELDVYHRGHWADRDPLLARAARPGCREVWQPKIWSSDPAMREYGEYIAGMGILSGVTVSLPSRDGMVSAITALSFTETLSDPKVAKAVSIIGRMAMMKAALLGSMNLDLPAVSDRIASLTGQQRTILSWAAGGKSNRDIADIMGMSKRAVDYHMSAILKKLGVASRAQAAVLYSGQ